MDPYSADTILYFRAIQGHSGGKHINPTLQDNVLLPSDFAEHIYHVGSSHDQHSIMQSGLIPGGKDVKKGRHAVFSTAVNPMFIDRCRERDYDVTKPRLAVYKHNWKINQNIVYWCNLRVAQSKGLQFYQTRSNAIFLYNTQLAVCIEKVVIRKSGQDTISSDATTTFDHSCKHRETCGGGTYNESCRGEIDFRIQGLLHSTVQEQDHTRKEPVQKVIHQFETHPNRNALQADVKQNHAFNPFSEQSKEMIYSMRNMEYFEICEITPKYSATTV